YKPSLDQEDIHMAVESRLIQLVGDIGGKLHTGRSRNDQVATDVRLWLRTRMAFVDAELKRLIEVLLRRAAEGRVLIPGFSHLHGATVAHGRGTGALVGDGVPPGKAPRGVHHGLQHHAAEAQSDAAELVRGRSARVIGDLQSLLVMVKGLPLAYNRDFQEDR